MPVDNASLHRPQRGPLRSPLVPIGTLLSSGGTVLTYHGVQERHSRPSSSMHVPLDTFARTMRAVGRVASFVPLRELVMRHLSGRPTRGLVAVTFDDAYASVATSAWRVLAELEIPVTMFVVTDAAVSGVPFWWDRVDALFDAANAEQWRAFEEACGLPATFRHGQPTDMGPLRPLRQWILAEHSGRWPEELEPVIARVERDLACGPQQWPLTFEQLDELVKSPLVDLGVHTVSHPVLPLLSDDAQRQEIRASFRILAERYACTLPVLAPPFGLYDRRTFEVLREEGLEACLSLEAASLRDGTQSALIPRFCMSARHPPWKAVLYAMGVWGGGRLRPRMPGRCPDLPSAST